MKNNKTNIQRNKSTIAKILPAKAHLAYASVKILIDRLRGYKKLKRLFFERMNYPLDLSNPSSYNQKIVWKKLYDRNPLLTITADKLAAREYVKQKLGKTNAEQILIPLFEAVEDPQKIIFSNLPDDFVIKPNHGSKMHRIVHDKNKEDIREITKECRSWLKKNYGVYQHEWAYKNIPRKILVEKLLVTNEGNLPFDYKFYCFHGKCHFLRVSSNKFDQGDTSAYFDRNWNLLPVYNPGYPIAESDFEKPANFEKMISVAELLSEDFDAIRIDLYGINNRIFFGEFTHYDGSGLARFEPEEFDFEMGSLWNLKKNYWKT